jgi:hypothetical protein
VGEVRQIASQLSTDEDPVIHAVAAIRYAVGQLLLGDDLGEDDYEVREQLQEAAQLVLHWMNPLPVGNSQYARTQRGLRDGYLDRWRELGQELDLATLIAEG